MSKDESDCWEWVEETGLGSALASSIAPVPWPIKLESLYAESAIIIIQDQDLHDSGTAVANLIIKDNYA